MFEKIKTWYKAQSDTTKAFIWIGLVALIGIRRRGASSVIVSRSAISMGICRFLPSAFWRYR